MTESGLLVVDPNMWATMTETERGKYLHELSMSGKDYMVDGVLYEQDLNLGPVTTRFAGLSWRG